MCVDPFDPFDPYFITLGNLGLLPLPLPYLGEPRACAGVPLGISRRMRVHRVKRVNKVPKMAFILAFLLTLLEIRVNGSHPHLNVGIRGIRGTRGAVACAPLSPCRSSLLTRRPTQPGGQVGTVPFRPRSGQPF
jgi:hypothetical protein